MDIYGDRPPSESQASAMMMSPSSHSVQP